MLFFNKLLHLFSINLIFFLLILGITPIFAGVDFANHCCEILVNRGAKLGIRTSISGWDGILEKKEGGSIKGDSVTFEHGKLEQDNHETSLTAKWEIEPNNKIILDGDKYISGIGHDVLHSFYVSGNNNRVEGNYVLSNDIQLADNNTELSLLFIGELNFNIYLNGGHIKLENDITFQENKRVVGPGKISLNHYRMVFGSLVSNWNDPIYFDSGNEIVFNSRINLSTNWTFSGRNVLNGNGNIFYLEDNGRLIVERGSSLMLKDMVLKKVSQGDVFCMDHSGTITFHNVKWTQDSDYTFSIGHFDIINEFKITGTHKFIYRSPMQSYILSRASLVLDDGVTFSYDPLVGRSDLLSFVDRSSILYLDGATLHSTLTGLQLTKGTMIVANNSYLSGEILRGRKSDIIVDNGISFGNNSIQDDFSCQILSGAKLEIRQGSLNYKNTQSDLFEMENSTSFLQFDLGSRLKLYQTLDVGNGKIKFSSGPQIWYMPDKQLLGSVESSGYVFYRPL